MSMEGDKGAEGLRFIMYCHAIAHHWHKKCFGTLFHNGAWLPEEDLGPLIKFERQNNIIFAADDLSCSVRIAFRFLCLSEHLTESFLAVWLEWLDDKVALLPVMQVSMNGVDVSNFFAHPSAHSVPTDTGIESGNTDHIARVTEMSVSLPDFFLELTGFFPHELQSNI